MLTVDLNRLDESTLDTAAQHYEEEGFLVLAGVEELAARFRPVLARRIGIDVGGLTTILDPGHRGVPFPREVRERLARIETAPELARWLLDALQALLIRLIGPFAHVSSTFHSQFKGGVVQAVDHGGYPPGSDYMEVHGPYLLHQDFAGASIPTSPSALTFWIAMNSCPHWTLRLYPGSHHRGLLCHEWLRLDDRRLAPLGNPVDVPAREGTAVLFHALALHGTGTPGAGRRVSCDIRFFPFCGFLPSEVHLLDPRPIAALRARLARCRGPVQQAPLLEDQVFLGEDVWVDDVPSHSVLNWVNYLAHLVRGRADEALQHLERFVNLEVGVDPPRVYAAKFHGRPIHESTLRQVRRHLSRNHAAEAADVAKLDALLARLVRGSPA